MNRTTRSDGDRRPARTKGAIVYHFGVRWPCLLAILVGLFSSGATDRHGRISVVSASSASSSSRWGMGGYTSSPSTRLEDTQPNATTAPLADATNLTRTTNTSTTTTPTSTSSWGSSPSMISDNNNEKKKQDTSSSAGVTRKSKFGRWWWKSNDKTSEGRDPPPRDNSNTSGPASQNETLTPPVETTPTTTTDDDDSSSVDHNNVTMPSDMTTPQPQPDMFPLPFAPPPGSRVIIMGSPPPNQQQSLSPYYQRRLPVYGMPNAPTHPGMVPGGIPPQGPPANMHPQAVLLLDVVASIVAAATRLWLLTWLTRRIVTQQESIQPVQHFVWERLNDRYVRDVEALQSVLQAPPTGVSRWQWKWRQRRWRRRRGGGGSASRQSSSSSSAGGGVPRQQPPLDYFLRTLLVVPLHTDGKEGLDQEYLSDVTSFILQQHAAQGFGTDPDTGKPVEVELVLLVQSPGGSVSSFGLAAAQLQRLRQVEGITLTCSVDKVAASGGYMIASQAHRLLAAPFATIGSIGVIMEGLNFHELADRYGIRPLVLKAGEQKNPLTTFGPVSDDELKHEQERLEKVHDAFKQLVVKARPALSENLKAVTEGNIFLGQEAKDLNLVDEVMTSDEYIQSRILAGDRVLKLHRSNLPRIARRLSLSPIDILPHLRTWLAKLDIKSAPSVLVMSLLLQSGGVLGFASHLLQKYYFNNR